MIEIIIIIVAIIILTVFAVVILRGYNKSNTSIKDYNFTDIDIKQATINFDGSIELYIDLSPGESSIIFRECDIDVMAQHFKKVK